MVDGLNGMRCFLRVSRQISTAAAVKIAILSIMSASGDPGVQSRTNAMSKEFIRPAYFTEKEVATRLGVSLKWMQKKRCQGGGIPFVRFGGAVRYSRDEILKYEATSARSSSSDNGQG